MIAKVNGRCDQGGCKVSEDGSCLEGHQSPQDCPHFVVQNSSLPEIESKQDVSSNSAEFSDTVDLPNGVDLNEDTAAVVTRANYTHVIVLAGAAGSGKTTLLTSIYEKFQEGPFAGYLFAGSRTLIGFEKRCHLARIESGKVKPDTERTKPGPAHSLLHLRIRDINLDGPARDLLFSDISGETFRIARDSIEECKKLGIIRRADHFILLLDGEKLSEIQRRQEALANGASLLRSCLDAGMLGKRSMVDILFTKYDLIERSNEQNATKGFIESSKESLKDRFEQKIGCLRFLEVAARPESSELPFAYGLDILLPSWVEENLYSGPRGSYTSISPMNEREFDRYLFKRLPQIRSKE